jgi:hypothetical protein
VSRGFRLGVGGRVIDFRVALEPGPLRPRFERSGGPADLTVVRRPGSPPAPGPRIAENFTWWKCHRSGENLQFRFDPTPRKRFWVRLNGRSAVAWVGPQENFFLYPIDELLFMELWGRRPGRLLLHAACVVERNAAWLLAGPSGSGKTTLSNLFALDGAKVLSDDRTVLECSPRRTLAHGTPWCGKGRWAEPGPAPLAGILLLRHGRINRLARLAPAQATARIMAVSFPPLWSRRGIENSLETAARAATRLPVLEYSFAPDRRAVRFLRNNLCLT